MIELERDVDGYINLPIRDGSTLSYGINWSKYINDSADLLSVNNWTLPAELLEVDKSISGQESSIVLKTKSGETLVVGTVYEVTNFVETVSGAFKDSITIRLLCKDAI